MLEAPILDGSMITTGSLPDKSEPIWKAVYLKLTKPSEGGFTDNVATKTKNGKTIRSDGHVTLFGMTATAYAEHIIGYSKGPTAKEEAKAKAAAKAEAEKLFREVGQYVELNGDYVAKIPPEIRTKLDNFRADSYNMWKIIHLKGQGFDQFKSPVLEGIMADISYHMGTEGSYRILAKAANIPVAANTRDPQWRASVLGAIKTMEEKLGAEQTIAILGKAKEAAHTSIRTFWESKASASAAKLNAMGDNTTAAYSKEYYEVYLPAQKAAENHRAWRPGFEKRVAAYNVLYQSMTAGDAATTLALIPQTETADQIPGTAKLTPKLPTIAEPATVHEQPPADINEILARADAQTRLERAQLAAGKVFPTPLAREALVARASQTEANTLGYHRTMNSTFGTIARGKAEEYATLRGAQTVDQIKQVADDYLAAKRAIAAQTGIPKAFTHYASTGNIIIDGKPFQIPKGADAATVLAKLSTAQSIIIKEGGPDGGVGDQIKQWIETAANRYSEVKRQARRDFETPAAEGARLKLESDLAADISDRFEAMVVRTSQMKPIAIKMTATDVLPGGYTQADLDERFQNLRPAQTAGVPQVIKDWITAGGIKLGHVPFGLPKGATTEAVDKAIMTALSDAEVITIVGKGPLARKIHEWVEKRTQVQTEFEQDTVSNPAKDKLYAFGKEHIDVLNASIKAHEKSGRKASMDEPAPAKINLALANAGVTVAKSEDDPALPPEVQKQMAKGGQEAGARTVT